MSALDDCYNVFDLRDAAKRKLPKAMFEFVDRSTEDEIALRNNRAAFEKIRLRHRCRMIRLICCSPSPMSSLT